MLTLDGSRGEGGGQILRTALGLSIVTGTPFRIENIRANREKPGLRPQHVTAVTAAQRVGAARVEGAEPGSRTLTFEPATTVAGHHRFKVGTAGSAMLVLQTVLPALLIARESSELVLEGGTHNPMAPPFDFLQQAFLPLVNRMGPRVEATLKRRGFYPAGGGVVQVSIRPGTPVPLELESGPSTVTRAVAVVSKLAPDIGQRELEIVGRRFKLPAASQVLEEETRSAGPGNVVWIETRGPVAEVFTGFGERGVRAEKIADRAADEAARFLDAGVAVGSHLADQLLIPLALARGGSFTTLPLSAHATTNMDVISMFLPVEWSVEPVAGGVRVRATG